MTGIRNLAEAEKVLASYVPLSAKITGKDITLGRTRQLMAALGNPEKQLRIIHVAGTSGKTSTTYYISALLKAAGQKVGTTISPHIDSVTERLQINLKPLSEQDFCKRLAEVIDLITAAGLEPTYFELLIAFAYWYFAKENVDYAVIETGMGGLQDATNVADNPDKVCVITDIGYDHMHVLGHTLPEIATQKAGIIHEQNQVFMYEQAPEVMDVFKKRITEKQAYLNLVPKDYASEVSGLTTLPTYQQRNWHVAHEVYNYLASRDNLPTISEAGLVEAMHVQVPARMDIRSIQDKTVIMDGAHNGQKMQAFVGSVQTSMPYKKAAILLSLKMGKEYAEVLPALEQLGHTVILSSFMQMQDLPSHAIDPQELLQPAEAAGFTNVIVEPDLDKAYKLLLSQPEDLLIITGSFYLIAQLRHAHKELR